MKYCTNCGKKLEENSEFCVECGTKVDGALVKPKKKTSGCSIASMVLGICVHAYQMFFYFVILLIADSISFLTTIFFGEKGHLTFLDKIEGTIFFLKYSYPILIALSITGIALGIVGSKKGNDKIAKAGIVLSILEIVIIAIEIIIYFFV